MRVELQAPLRSRHASDGFPDGRKLLDPPTAGEINWKNGNSHCREILCTIRGLKTKSLTS